MKVVDCRVLVLKEVNTDEDAAEVLISFAKAIGHPEYDGKTVYLKDIMEKDPDVMEIKFINKKRCSNPLLVDNIERVLGNNGFKIIRDPEKYEVTFTKPHRVKYIESLISVLDEDEFMDLLKILMDKI